MSNDLYHQKAQQNTIRAGFKDLEPDFLAMADQCKAYTQTTMERMYALHKSVAHITRNNIPGAIVECGVWRGGSMMMSAYSLLALNVHDRPLYLYDTYEGQPEPSDVDRDIWGNAQRQGWQRFVKDGVYTGERPPIDEVRENLRKTGYDESRIILIKGKVEDTLPAQLPGPIAILRLDTDWYESVAHTFTHLYPLLSHGGVLIVDDYGHLEGARKATDEYMAALKSPPMLFRVDYSCRTGVKP